MRFIGGAYSQIPDLSSKLIDWNAVANSGGEEMFRDRAVLELGPCFGLDALLWSQMAAEYVAVDHNVQVQEWFAERVREAKFIKADFASLPLPDNYFHTVVDFSAIDDSKDPWPAYAEAVRVLKPGGVFLTTFANQDLLPNPVGHLSMRPLDVLAFLTGRGTRKRYLANWHHERAVVVVKKL